MGAEPADGAVHAPLDVVDDAALEVADEGLVGGKEGRGGEGDVPDSHLRDGVEEGVDGEVTVAEVVVDADGHPVAQAALLQGLAQGAHPLVGAVVRVGGDARRGLGARGAVGADTLEDGLGLAVDLQWDASADGVQDEVTHGRLPPLSCRRTRPF